MKTNEVRNSLHINPLESFHESLLGQVVKAKQLHHKSDSCTFLEIILPLFVGKNTLLALEFFLESLHRFLTLYLTNLKIYKGTYSIIKVHHVL